MNKVKVMYRYLGLALLLACLTPQAMAHGEGAPSAQPVHREQLAWGIAAEAGQVTRTLQLRMNDQMRFEPDQLQVQLGETVRLQIQNDGKMLHELVLGTPQELEKHAELMLRFPGMQHDEPYMAHVNPGQSGEIIWTFNRAGTFDFACLIAGHYQAGMRGKVQVADQ
jgi:uncharacterized cupredoxin-like copper-binding protein